MCIDGLCAGIVPNDGGSKRIFVTAASYSGNLGGLAGADQKCNLAAQAETLGGGWKAWLSDSTTNAIDRIQDVGPWTLVGQTIIFKNKANLTTIPVHSVDITEQGKVVSSANVWTGTQSGGQGTNGTCQGWTYSNSSYYGTAGSVLQISEWTSSVASSCSEENHLYCIEQ